MTDSVPIELGGLSGGAPEPGPFDVDPCAKIGDLAAESGVQRVELVAWRDLDHPEAGGSEIHAARIAERWAAAGIDVRLVVSRSPGAPRESARDGYNVLRPAGRYGIFPVAGAGRFVGSRREADATVEIWNGMPFFSPLWARQPRVVFLHHVHDRMWDLVLPRSLAAVGRLVERRVAPPLYRTTPVVTLSESSRDAIVGVLGLHPGQVTVVPPGVDESFVPGSRRSPDPLVVAVGRLVRYKRFDRLIEVLVRLRERHPGLRAVIAGEGFERPALEALITSHGATEWIRLPGRIADAELIDLYQRAWVLASTSAYEGWGLTISEAAACATPAVVSAIPGHSDAVLHGVTGFLAEPGLEMEHQLDLLLRDPLIRRRMQRSAREHSSTLTWDRSAVGTMQVLADQASRCHPRNGAL